jgi:hypothetical protein
VKIPHPYFKVWTRYVGLAIGDWPKHWRMRFSRHCRLWKVSRWRFTLTVFSGSGHWLASVGPFWVQSNFWDNL